MTLSKAERSDPLWLKLKAEYESRLAQLRKDNDKDMSEAATANLRGRIAEIRKFLSLGEEKPVIDIE